MEHVHGTFIHIDVKPLARCEKLQDWFQVLTPICGRILGGDQNMFVWCFWWSKLETYLKQTNT